MKVLVFDVSDTFPTLSVAVADTVWLPLVSAAGATKLQVPSAATTGAPATGTPSMRTVTVVPGSPVPVMVGVAMLTVLPVAGPTTTGVMGALVSTENRTGVLSGVVPLALVAEAVATWAPSERALASGGVQVYVPAAVLTVVHNTTPSTLMLTVTLGLVTPIKAGRLFAVVLPFAGAVSVGVVGSAPKVATTAWSLTMFVSV